MSNHRAYYLGAGLSFNHKEKTVTSFDTGNVIKYKNLFTDVAMLKKRYFSLWVERELSPTKQ